MGRIKKNSRDIEGLMDMVMEIDNASEAVILRGLLQR